MSAQDRGGKAQPAPKPLPHPASGTALPALSLWDCSLVPAVCSSMSNHLLCLESASYHKPNLYIHTNNHTVCDIHTVQSVSATAQVRTLAIVKTPDTDTLS